MQQPIDIARELQLTISMSATPAVSFRTEGTSGLGAPAAAEGFIINVEGSLQYSALTRILNDLLVGRRFDLSEGLIPMYVVVQKAAVGADVAGNLLIKVQFTGSFGGAVLLKGKPIYNAARQAVQIANMDYDLQSKSILLNSAKWLLNDKIAGELQKRSEIPIAHHLHAGKAAVVSSLNREWAKGVSGEGTVTDLALDEIVARPEYFHIKCHCSGNFLLRLTVPDFGKQR